MKIGSRARSRHQPAMDSLDGRCLLSLIVEPISPPGPGLTTVEVGSGESGGDPGPSSVSLEPPSLISLPGEIVLASGLSGSTTDAGVPGVPSASLIGVQTVPLTALPDAMALASFPSGSTMAAGAGAVLNPQAVGPVLVALSAPSGEAGALNSQAVSPVLVSVPATGGEAKALPVLAGFTLGPMNQPAAGVLTLPANATFVAVSARGGSGSLTLISDSPPAALGTTATQIATGTNGNGLVGVNVSNSSQRPTPTVFNTAPTAEVSAIAPKAESLTIGTALEMSPLATATSPVPAASDGQAGSSSPPAAMIAGGPLVSGGSSRSPVRLPLEGSDGRAAAPSPANGQLEAIVERLPGGKGVTAAPPRELPWAAPPPRGAGLITALSHFDHASIEESVSRFLSRFPGNHGLVESAAERDPNWFVVAAAAAAIEAVRRWRNRVVDSTSRDRESRRGPAFHGLS